MGCIWLLKVIEYTQKKETGGISNGNDRDQEEYKKFNTDSDTFHQKGWV